MKCGQSFTVFTVWSFLEIGLFLSLLVFSFSAAIMITTKGPHDLVVEASILFGWILVLVLVGGAMIEEAKERIIKARKLRGLCIHCEYDSRGNTDPHICPECGNCPERENLSTCGWRL